VSAIVTGRTVKSPLDRLARCIDRLGYEIDVLFGIIRNFVSGACLGSPDDEPFFEQDSELRLRFRPFPC
jgi:hypothetical protein